jgi:hypothetical protein
MLVEIVQTVICDDLPLIERYHFVGQQFLPAGCAGWKKVSAL